METQILAAVARADLLICAAAPLLVPAATAAALIVAAWLIHLSHKED